VHECSLKQTALNKIYQQQSVDTTSGFPQEGTPHSEYVGFAHTLELSKPNSEHSCQRKNENAAQHTLKTKANKKIKQEIEESVLQKDIQEALKEQVPVFCTICNKQFKTTTAINQASSRGGQSISWIQ
jgi:hypothetical protein